MATWNRGFSRFYPPEGSTPYLLLPDLIVKFHEADVCTIGRAPTCHITVPRNIVSQVHARIERDGLRYMLHDVGSPNGTFVNHVRMNHPHLLKDHDSALLPRPAADRANGGTGPSTVAPLPERWQPLHTRELRRRDLGPRL